ncbi:O-antigen ligase family protein [Qipengyuania sp.]|uniref:O-antigen ligase family protein n=1 Tax=Qipengyuania sp. TaxID=2004515 RepID=UPI0035C7E7DD
MSDALASYEPDTPRVAARSIDPVLIIGAAIGLTPVLAAIIFRTYVYHVTPGWPEGLRQLDVPFILVELAVVLWARQRGMRYGEIFQRFDRPAKIAIGVFLGTFWISSAFISADPVYSLVRASYWLVHIAFACAIFHVIGAPNRDQLQRLGLFALAGFLIFLPVMAIHLGNVPDPDTVRGGKIIWSSAIPGCLSVRHLGIWAALVLACALGSLYEFNANGRERTFVFAVIFAATALLFWSGTRGGVYGLGGAVFVILLTLRTFPPRRAILIAGAAAILGVLASEIWLPPDPAFGFFGRLGVVGSGDLQEVSSGRTVLWANMMHAFQGSPLFGVGEGAVHWIGKLHGESHVQPHNAIVQMLSSWGLIACSAAGYLMARFLLLLHRVAKANPIAIPLMLLVDCLLVMSLVDGVLYFSRFIMWFAGGVALVLALADKNREVGRVPSHVAR